MPAEDLRECHVQTLSPRRLCVVIHGGRKPPPSYLRVEVMQIRMVAARVDRTAGAR